MLNKKKQLPRNSTIAYNKHTQEHTKGDLNYNKMLYQVDPQAGITTDTTNISNMSAKFHLLTKYFHICSTIGCNMKL